MQISQVIDAAWGILYLAIILICVFIGMFTSAVYLIPIVLQSANCAPRDTLGGIIEFVMIFGGLFVGSSAALFLICNITRRFISHTTYDRWVRQIEKAKPNMPGYTNWLNNYIAESMKPNSYVPTTSNKSSNLTGAENVPPS